MICFRLRLTSVSRTFCYAKLRSLPQANVRYFFARFDLMKWKDYGIMIWYEKRKEHEEMLKCLR